MNPELYGNTITAEEFMMAEKAVSSITPELVEQVVSVFVLLILWSFIWKGIALWKAAQNDSVPWFVALLLVNTVGILEILYIFVFSKKHDNADETKDADGISDEVIQAELKKMKEEVEEAADTEERKEIA